MKEQKINYNRYLNACSVYLTASGWQESSIVHWENGPQDGWIAPGDKEKKVLSLPAALAKQVALDEAKFHK